MSDLTRAEALFFNHTEWDAAAAQSQINDALHGMDDGELFLELSQSESLLFDDGRLKTASYNASQGFGLRGVAGEHTAYAHSTDFSLPALKRACATIRSATRGMEVKARIAGAPTGTNRILYKDINPIEETPFEAKVSLLAEIDAYLRNSDPRVKQVTASIYNGWQVVEILHAGGHKTADIRPLVRLNVMVVAEQNGRMERGSSGAGARVAFTSYMQPERWKKLADEALRQALVNIESVPAPAGEMPIVLGPGWPGVLLHEAVGHGLEGDFNRKKTSAFSGLLGQRVAAKGVTVVDDGTLPDLRGSITVDDEGTPSERTVLIEDGILKGYLQDRMNARLMGMKPTGNGRRESFAHCPMPRMTNTYMLAGKESKESIISSVKKGLYAVNFGGGQVDITSGKFVFSASEAYLIEDGKITRPVKGATLVGNGPDVMTKVTAIGNDMKLDDGIGTCGKSGQSVPVGVGQPTLLISHLTVGGTEI